MGKPMANRKQAKSNRFEGLEDVVEDPKVEIRLQQKEVSDVERLRRRKEAREAKAELREFAFVKPAGKGSKTSKKKGPKSAPSTTDVVSTDISVAPADTAVSPVAEPLITLPPQAEQVTVIPAPATLVAAAAPVIIGSAKSNMSVVAPPPGLRSAAAPVPVPRPVSHVAVAPTAAFPATVMSAEAENAVLRAQVHLLSERVRVLEGVWGFL